MPATNRNKDVNAVKKPATIKINICPVMSPRDDILKFPVKGVTRDTLVKEFKDKAEMVTGIPTNLQRIHYIDEGELLDPNTLRSYDVIPGACLCMKIWSLWQSLVEAAFFGDIDEVFRLGVTKDGGYQTPQSEYMNDRQRASWVSERAFVALYVASQRGHHDLCQKLLQTGAKVNGKTASGRTPLHIAAATGQKNVIGVLLEAGADMKAVDADGNTAMALAIQYGHKDCQQFLVQFSFKARSKNCKVPLPVPPLLAHQYFDSALATHLTGEQAQMYCQQLLPPGEFEGTTLGAPRRKSGLQKGGSAGSRLKSARENSLKLRELELARQRQELGIPEVPPIEWLGLKKMEPAIDESKKEVEQEATMMDKEVTSQPKNRRENLRRPSPIRSRREKKSVSSFRKRNIDDGNIDPMMIPYDQYLILASQQQFLHKII